MSKYINKFLMMALCAISASTLLNAEIVDRMYLQWIRQVEDLIPNLWVASEAEKKATIEIIKNNLQRLRANTKDSYRLRRINKAAMDFNDFMNSEKNRTRVQQNIPLSNAQPPIASNPAPIIRGMTPEQQLETLLLYVQSLASTADVAIVVGQKNNAQIILNQAAMQIPSMQLILQQHPSLVQRFATRIHMLNDRIINARNSADLMA